VSVPSVDFIGELRKRAELLAELGRAREAVPLLQQLLATTPDDECLSCRVESIRDSPSTSL
jgi:hypothetical protein